MQVQKLADPVGWSGLTRICWMFTSNRTPGFDSVGEPQSHIVQTNRSGSVEEGSKSKPCWSAVSQPRRMYRVKSRWGGRTYDPEGSEGQCRAVALLVDLYMCCPDSSLQPILQTTPGSRWTSARTPLAGPSLEGNSYHRPLIIDVDSLRSKVRHLAGCRWTAMAEDDW